MPRAAGGAGGSSSVVEPRIDGRVRERAEAVRDPEAHRVPVAGLELTLSKEDFVRRRLALLQRELIADPAVAARAVERERLEQAHVEVAGEGHARPLGRRELLREDELAAHRSPRLIQAQRHADAVLGHCLLEAIEDRRLEVVVVRDADVVLDRQAALRRLAVREEVELDRRRQAHRALRVRVRRPVHAASQAPRQPRAEAADDEHVRAEVAEPRLDRLGLVDLERAAAEAAVAAETNLPVLGRAVGARADFVVPVERLLLAVAVRVGAEPEHPVVPGIVRGERRAGLACVGDVGFRPGLAVSRELREAKRASRA